MGLFLSSLLLVALPLSAQNVARGVRL
ncbi:MAG: hypothetical protein FD126_2785, partial [Elusimicrobia bacterium]